jgi:transcriptional regulator with XRE-family HTH domain
MSLETLAKLSGLTPNYIGKLERGLVNPALSTITLIAAGLGESLGGLLGNAQHLSPSAVRMARLLDQAPPQVRRGVVALLRGAAQAKKKTPDSEP